MQFGLLLPAELSSWKGVRKFGETPEPRTRKQVGGLGSSHWSETVLPAGRKLSCVRFLKQTPAQRPMDGSSFPGSAWGCMQRGSASHCRVRAPKIWVPRRSLGTRKKEGNMGLFSKPEAEAVEVNGRAPMCLICGHGRFNKRAALLQKTGESWLINLGCCRCMCWVRDDYGLVHWFLPKEYR